MIGKILHRTLPLAALFAPIAQGANAQIVLPTNAQSDCTVTETEVEGWFGGTITAGGAVSPPAFTQIDTNSSVCDFYIWGAQIFLWLTSPDGAGTVLEGDSIFTVNTSDWTLFADGDQPMQMATRQEKDDDIGGISQTDSQAGVLMSQAGSLVYYGVHVNDVYGYFLTGQKCGAENGQANCTDPATPYLQTKNFPYDQGHLDAVVTFAKDHLGVDTVPDEDVLVLELKTSWVDASTLADQTGYVIIEGTVPAFEQTSDTLWTQSGSQDLSLALVGMHIVATVQNHPEFVWATFEHMNNTPMAPYFYDGSDFMPTTFQAENDFLFFPKGGTIDGANLECMGVKNGNIAALTDASGALNCAGGIVPSKTVRMFPWGNPSMTQTGAVTSNNAMLIKLNRSVLGALAEGDPRAQYFQLGSIWTSIPDGATTAPVPNQGMFSYYSMRGSLSLSNSTMETYTQGSTCFDCHSVGSTTDEDFGLSHIYSRIAPLPVPTP